MNLALIWKRNLNWLKKKKRNEDVSKLYQNKPTDHRNDQHLSDCIAANNWGPLHWFVRTERGRSCFGCSVFMLVMLSLKRQLVNRIEQKKKKKKMRIYIVDTLNLVRLL